MSVNFSQICCSLRCWKTIQPVLMGTVFSTRLSPRDSDRKELQIMPTSHFHIHSKVVVCPQLLFFCCCYAQVCNSANFGFQGVWPMNQSQFTFDHDKSLHHVLVLPDVLCSVQYIIMACILLSNNIATGYKQYVIPLHYQPNLILHTHSPRVRGIDIVSKCRCPLSQSTNCLSQSPPVKYLCINHNIQRETLPIVLYRCPQS